MKTEQKHGDAYEAVRVIYDKSPGRSWQRLNGALYQTLMAAITAHLSFEREDFNAIARDFNGGYWMGNSSGSHCGENFYTHAVEVGHTPACISFEDWAERPAALWSEKVKTPERLRIGSKFTWEGLEVSVTTMSSDHLIACHYEGYRWDHTGPKVGNAEHFDGSYRVIEEMAPTGTGAVRVHFSAPVADPERKPSRRFRITYAELSARRKQHDTDKKKVIAGFAAAESEGALFLFAKTVSDFKHLYRPFDIDELSKALYARKEEIRKGKPA